MRRVLGAWLVFLLVAGPRVASLLERDATILSRLTSTANRKHPPQSPQVPGHRQSLPVRRSGERSAGSANVVRSRSRRATEVPPTFLNDPLAFLSRAPGDSLQLLPGIGPVLADRIASARVGDRPFTTWSDVLRVRGIGPKTIAKLQSLSSIPR